MSVLSSLRRIGHPQGLRPGLMHCLTRAIVTTSTTSVSTRGRSERAGDISDAFASMSGKEFAPLEPRYATLKKRLIEGREDALCASWSRLLTRLRSEISQTATNGSESVPEIQYSDIAEGKVGETFAGELRKRGVAVVRGVVDEETALGYKQDIKAYVNENPHTKAFPANNPQVFELYWSSPQMRARLHPHMLATQRYLMSFWHSRDPNAQVSTEHPIAYADRLRIRLPGDAQFALGPHMDGGSVERWETEGYGLGGVYDKILEGKWEDYDPWESSCRLPVVTDMHQGVGPCSMFRMFQGWLSMSETGPFEGTLLVNPMLKHATAYVLLRPFFSPKTLARDPESATFDTTFLDASNWELELEPSSWLHGATPGQGQELRAILHPHLELSRSMVHVPKVRPGDYVAWHCDTIHAVDQKHTGTSDSSVMYIPTCPLTEKNAHYLVRQRERFIQGMPSPDFGGGEGESNHTGRPKTEDVASFVSLDGMRAFGLEKWDEGAEGLTPGSKKLLVRSNRILGFQ